MNHIKYLLATIAAFTFVMLVIMFPVLLKAQDEIPEGMYEKQIKMSLGCTEGFMAMIDILHDNYQEVPVVMSHLDMNTTFVLFVNEKRTTSTLVITKNLKHKEEACIVWAGQSNGTSLSINPNPIFPVKPFHGSFPDFWSWQLRIVLNDPQNPGNVFLLPDHSQEHHRTPGFDPDATLIKTFSDQGQTPFWKGIEGLNRLQPFCC